jgi:hypothetical protein
MQVENSARCKEREGEAGKEYMPRPMGEAESLNVQHFINNTFSFATCGDGERDYHCFTLFWRMRFPLPSSLLMG